MELKSILAGIEGLKVKGSLEIDIPKIESSSQKIKPGDMFVAIDGFDTDGHQYITEAVQNGAKVIMAQADKLTREMVKDLPADITFILAPDTRHAVAICACNYYQNPSKKLKLIGVTGTKGKTTTTFMIKEILEKMQIEGADGILLDLGVSSYQIDNEMRGFSYIQENAPLDIRMDKTEGY